MGAGVGNCPSRILKAASSKSIGSSSTDLRKCLFKSGHAPAQRNTQAADGRFGAVLVQTAKYWYMRRRHLPTPFLAAAGVQRRHRRKASGPCPPLCGGVCQEADMHRAMGNQKTEDGFLDMRAVRRADYARQCWRMPKLMIVAAAAARQQHRKASGLRPALCAGACRCMVMRQRSGMQTKKSGTLDMCLV